MSFSCVMKMPTYRLIRITYLIKINDILYSFIPTIFLEKIHIYLRSVNEFTQQSIRIVGCFFVQLEYGRLNVFYFLYFATKSRRNLLKSLLHSISCTQSFFRALRTSSSCRLTSFGVAA